MLHHSLPWKQRVSGTSFSTLGWRALESNGRRTTPALWKSLCTTIAGGVRSSVLQRWLEGPAGWPGTSFCCMNRKAEINLCLMEKAALRKVAQQKKEKKEKSSALPSDLPGTPAEQQLGMPEAIWGWCKGRKWGEEGTHERKPPDSFSEANRWTGISYPSVDSSLLNLKEWWHRGIFACGVLPIQHKVLRCHEAESFLST